MYSHRGYPRGCRRSITARHLFEITRVRVCALSRGTVYALVRELRHRNVAIKVTITHASRYAMRDISDGSNWRERIGCVACVTRKNARVTGSGGSAVADDLRNDRCRVCNNFDKFYPAFYPWFSCESLFSYFSNSPPHARRARSDAKHYCSRAREIDHGTDVGLSWWAFRPRETIITVRAIVNRRTSR